MEFFYNDFLKRFFYNGLFLQQFFFILTTDKNSKEIEITINICWFWNWAAPMLGNLLHVLGNGHTCVR